MLKHSVTDFIHNFPALVGTMSVIDLLVTPLRRSSMVLLTTMQPLSIIAGLCSAGCSCRLVCQQDGVMFTEKWAGERK